ncbi:hypothetical protein OROHE_006000 [Orobanche hederae]
MKFGWSRWSPFERVLWWSLVICNRSKKLGETGLEGKDRYQGYFGTSTHDLTGLFNGVKREGYSLEFIEISVLGLGLDLCW